MSNIWFEIGKAKFYRQYESGSMTRGNRKGTKKAALPTAAVVDRKGTKNLKYERNYELGVYPWDKFLPQRSLDPIMLLQGEMVLAFLESTQTSRIF
jgi:hypothetical protein